MTLIDYILLGGVASAVAGGITYWIKQKKRGDCGCGCNGCPHAGACSSNKSKPKQEEKD